jgi:hypothetical protein
VWAWCDWRRVALRTEAVEAVFHVKHQPGHVGGLPIGSVRPLPLDFRTSPRKCRTSDEATAGRRVRGALYGSPACAAVRGVNERSVSATGGGTQRPHGATVSAAHRVGSCDVVEPFAVSFGTRPSSRLQAAPLRQ